jgi:hypothetical protein
VVSILGQIERFDAEPVTRHDRAAAVTLVQDEGEHALEAINAGLAPSRPCLDDDLGVALGKEAVAETLKLLAKFRIVVEAAVEDQGDPELGIDHGLLGLFRQIDDLEAAMTQSDGTPQNDPGAVRPSRRQGLGHALQGVGVYGTPVVIDLAAQAAHRLSLYCECSVHK